MKYYNLAFFAVLLLFTGCAGSQFVTRDQVEIDRDPYKSVVTYSGITQRNTNGQNMYSTGYSYFIRSWTESESMSASHQIYIESMYVGDWKFYRKATLLGGEELEVIDIDSEVVTCTGYGICTLKEVIGVDLPHEYLVNNPDGISMKVFAQSGDEIIVDLSADQISAQLTAMGAD